MEPAKTAVEGGAPEPAADVHRRPAEGSWGLWRSPEGLTVVALLALFALTNKWFSWGGGIRYLREGDVASYEAMARAAPGLPTRPIGSAYSERFFVHYFAGLLDDVTPLDLPQVYRTLWALALLGIVLAVGVTLRRLGVGGARFAVAMTLLVLSPYAFRYYAIVPGMLADLVFELGIALALLGTVSRRAGAVLLGAVVAAATRQTALLALPVLALWLVTDRSWPARRRPLAAAVLVLPFVVYGAVKVITSSFTHPFAPEIPGDTVLHDLAGLPSSASTLAGHSLRVLAPLLVVLLLLVVSAVPLGRAVLRQRAFWLSVTVGLVISLQAWVISPSFPGFDGNEPRISALGLIPFVVALAVVLPAGLDGPVDGRPRPRWLVPVLLALLAVASLHHIYTSVGPRNTGQFLAVQVVVAAVASALVARRTFRAPQPTAAASRAQPRA